MMSQLASDVREVYFILTQFAVINRLSLQMSWFEFVLCVVIRKYGHGNVSRLVSVPPRNLQTHVIRDKLTHIVITLTCSVAKAES